MEKLVQDLSLFTIPFVSLISLFASSLVLSLPHEVPSNIDAASVHWWCDATPYPETCRFFMSQTTTKGLPWHASDLHKISIQLAMQRARTAQAHTKLLEPEFQDVKEKTAWSDCLKLYEETISTLNKTLEQNTSYSDHDVQTWLSTALTNLETCKTGFIELNVSNGILPLMTNNVSKLICNTLALNNNITNSTSTSSMLMSRDNTFPTWVSGGDRRLLTFTSPTADLVVAQDGSGNYRTIKAAVEAVAVKRKGSTKRFIIRVKKGVYKENIEIGYGIINIMLAGDGIKNTIITGDRSVGGGSTTFSSATFAVSGEGFIARDITFRNSAGPQNHQAVALRSSSDHSVFYHCGFEGYQDTLFVHSQRQFYKECYIYGTIDFIFGNAAVVFQNCNIYVRKPMRGQSNVITAQGRTDPNQNTGIVIQNSRVMASSDLKPLLRSFKTYLGRPWKDYSRTVFMRTYMDSLVDRKGWLEWRGNFALDTLYYGEYNNLGPGASTSNRVRWHGYHAMKSATQASKFSVANFISGQSWLPTTSVPFAAGV